MKRIWGDVPVHFTDVFADIRPPQAFVVMQFGEHYDTVYRDVIQRVANDAGYKAHRADDVYGPGLILADIIRDIVESDLVIADITPKNPNVFYELGYAHALGKPTIPLSERGPDRLPFDVSGYRCIFYDNTIKGENELEAALKRHLDAIRGGEQ